MIKQIIQQSLILLLASILIGLSVNAVRPNGLSFRADELPQLESTGPNLEDVSESVIATISLEQAKEFYDKGTPFVDARGGEYFHEGHIKGAIPSDNFMEMIFTLDSLLGDRTAPVVTYCDGNECGSSEELAYDLQASGFTKIYVFIGGWSDWSNANYPVTQ